MSYYAESPIDRIVDVHWKKKHDGGPPDPDDTWPCGGDCTYGWFPMANFFPGGGGFPPQLGFGNADLRVGGQVEWNPIAITEHVVDLFGINKFLIPGSCATSMKISVIWRDVIEGGGGGPPLVVGIWDMPGHQAWPPYLDGFGNPPANPPPHNPTVSASIGPGSGSLVYTVDAPIGTTLSVGFVGTARSSPIPPPVSPPPLVPSTRGDVGGIHYGWPGEPGEDPDFTLYIRIDYACTEDSSGGLIMPPRRIRRR